MRYFYLSFLFLVNTVIVSCQDKNNDRQIDTVVVSKQADKEITLLFLGDIMQHDLQIQSAYNTKTGKYDFSSQFEHIQAIIKNVDAVVGNFEVTLSGKPYKGYPRFSSPDALAYDIKKAGIDYLVTANNHVYDYGIKGFYRTLNVLDSAGFVRTGVFSNAADKEKNQPMLIEKNGMRVALLNYTYNVNGGKYSPNIIINKIDSSLIKNDLTRVKNGNFDAIIVFFHWGKEYERHSNQQQRDLEKFCFENGADVIIGSHPHVIQEMKKYRFKSKSGIEKDVFIAYSLGNYVSNYGTWRYCDGGALAQIKLVKHPDGKLSIEDAGYYLIWVYRPKRSTNSKLRDYYVLPAAQYENDTSLGISHLKQMRLFINDSRSLLKKNNVNVPEYLYDEQIKGWKLVD
jgi:poly-gamma-glutamate synthesis protein (capsule biosynthesis protein)